MSRPARMRLSVGHPLAMRVLLSCVGLIPVVCAAFLLLVGALTWTALRGPWWMRAIEGVFLYGVLLIGIYVLCASAYFAFAHATYRGWLRGTALTLLIAYRKKQVDLSLATVRYDDRSSVLTATDPRSGTELTLNIDAFGDAMLPATQLTALANAISAGRSENETQQAAFAVARRLRTLARVASGSGPALAAPRPEGTRSQPTGG
ncbi:hypothetical protein ACFOW4_22980 [Micromonospora sp. GCM10011542]|uniref:hypothetical protein n=1 Tax=Micromonospora sp. GCM10011542 TaxID=3317337 RepID=UPI003617566A